MRLFLDEIMQDAVEKLQGKESLETRVQVHFAKLADDIQQHAGILMIKQLICCLVCNISFC